MKITVFIGGLSGGGAERVACNLSNYLFWKKHDIDIVTMSETPNVYGLENGINQIVLLEDIERSNKLVDNIKRYKRLKKYVKGHRENTYVVFLPITICLLLHFSRLIKGNIIVSERNDPNQYSKIQQVLLKFYASRADKWVFQTEEAEKWYSEKIKESVIIPNAINKEFLNEEEDENVPKEKLIIASGRLNKQKNYYLLLDVFEEIASIFKSYKLEILGKGPLEDDIKRYANKKNCSDRIIFSGYVDNVKEHMKKAEVYVLSSDYEGMPNSLMEAMALGLPCVSTDCPCGGPKYLIENNVNGVLVPVNDVQKMVDALKTILNDKDLGFKLGKEASKIKEKLNPEVIYSKWEKTITGEQR